MPINGGTGDINIVVSVKADDALQQLALVSKAAMEVGKSFAYANSSIDALALKAQKTTSDLRALTDTLTKTNKKVEEYGKKAAKTGKVVSTSIPAQALISSIEQFAERILAVYLVMEAYRRFRQLIYGVANAVFETNAQLEDMNLALKYMTGNAAAASGMLQQLAYFAARTPFEMENLMPALRWLLAAGYSFGEATEMMKTIGDAAAALGQGSEGAERMIVAIAKLKLYGKVYARTLNTLAAAGINIEEGLAKRLGMTLTELRQKLASGFVIPSEVAVGALMDYFKEKFGEAMAEASNTWHSLMSNLRDLLNLTLAQMGKGIFDKMKGYLQSLVNVMDRFYAISRAVGGNLFYALIAITSGPIQSFIVGFYSVYALSIKFFSIVFLGAKIIAGFVNRITILRKMFSGLSAAIGGAIAMASMFVMAYGIVYSMFSLVLRVLQYTVFWRKLDVLATIQQTLAQQGLLAAIKELLKLLGTVQLLAARNLIVLAALIALSIVFGSMISSIEAQINEVMRRNEERIKAWEEQVKQAKAQMEGKLDLSNWTKSLNKLQKKAKGTLASFDEIHDITKQIEEIDLSDMEDVLADISGFEFPEFPELEDFPSLMDMLNKWAGDAWTHFWTGGDQSPWGGGGGYSGLGDLSKQLQDATDKTIELNRQLNGLPNIQRQVQIKQVPDPFIWSIPNPAPKQVEVRQTPQPFAWSIPNPEPKQVPVYQTPKPFIWAIPNPEPKQVPVYQTPNPLKIAVQQPSPVYVDVYYREHGAPSTSPSTVPAPSDVKNVGTKTTNPISVPSVPVLSPTISSSAFEYTIKETFKETLEGATKALAAAGAAIGAAIIANMQTAGVSAGAAFGTGFQTGASLALSIRSPSRVMQWIGEMTTLGFVIGIEKRMDKVKRATTTMSGIVSNISKPSLPSMGQITPIGANLPDVAQNSMAMQKTEPAVVVLEVDGKELARAQLPHLAAEQKRIGLPVFVPRG